MFVVHEDLLCANSLFFRQELQPERKDIAGDCSICLVNLERGLQELTFCKLCGKNFHFDCIENLKRQAAGHPVSCPLCRHEWSDRRLSQCKEFLEINPKDFGKYYEWLYKGCITHTQSLKEQDNEGKTWFSSVLRTLQLGADIQDEKFYDTIMEAAVETAFSKLHIDNECLLATFESIEFGDPLEKILADVTVHLMVWCGNWNDWPSWTFFNSDFLGYMMIRVLKDHPLRLKYAQKAANKEERV
ncbi:hypothetical protein yc1106_00485 [Curvularia clavata]|uniref:RING-type domain-containing protein n=1 Tax=Curvularia clavata TaxID=95742 RepID=A0A9Q8YZN6_CURCL|nr:hypothetical protein yc1106_00485 [Curvularia clavata]